MILESSGYCWAELFVHESPSAAWVRFWWLVYCNCHFSVMLLKCRFLYKLEAYAGLSSGHEIFLHVPYCMKWTLLCRSTFSNLSFACGPPVYAMYFKVTCLRSIVREELSSEAQGCDFLAAKLQWSCCCENCPRCGIHVCSSIYELSAFALGFLSLLIISWGKKTGSKINFLKHK